MWQHTNLEDGEPLFTGIFLGVFACTYRVWLVMFPISYSSLSNICFTFLFARE